MRVFDEPWRFSDFVHLTDEADAGTRALYDETPCPDEDGEPPPASLVVDGGSLRWRPAPEPGGRPGEEPAPRVRLVLETPAGDEGSPADGVLAVPTGVLLVSDASLRLRRRVTVPAGDHEVRVRTAREGGVAVHEVSLRRVPGRGVPGR